MFQIKASFMATDLLQYPKKYAANLMHLPVSAVRAINTFIFVGAIRINPLQHVS